MRRATAVRRRGCTDRGRCSRGRGARAARLCDARPVGPSVRRDFGVCTVGREAPRAGGQRRRRLALQEFSHECHRPRIVRYPRCNERNGCGPCARRDGCGALAGCQAPVWRVPMRSLVAAVVGGLMPATAPGWPAVVRWGAYFSPDVSGSLHGWWWHVAAFAATQWANACVPFPPGSRANPPNGLLTRYKLRPTL